MSKEENFIDSSEHWGVVTDHVDWFTTTSYESVKLWLPCLKTTYLYIFTHDTFRGISWKWLDQNKPANHVAFQDYVDKEIANPSTNAMLFNKSEIRSFRIEHYPVGAPPNEYSQVLIYMDYGDRAYHFFECDKPQRLKVDQVRDIHARLVRGLNRKLKPFPGDLEAQKEHERANILPGELWEIDI